MSITPGSKSPNTGVFNGATTSANAATSSTPVDLSAAVSRYIEDREGFINSLNPAQITQLITELDSIGNGKELSGDQQALLEALKPEATTVRAAGSTSGDQTIAHNIVTSMQEGAPKVDEAAPEASA